MFDKKLTYGVYIRFLFERNKDTEVEIEYRDTEAVLVTCIRGGVHDKYVHAKVESGAKGSIGTRSWTLV